MIEYEFYKNEIGTPQFCVKGNLEGLSELGSCDYEYLLEIIENLEKVKSGDLEEYDFGYEVYSIECKKEISQIIDTYDSWKSIAEISTEDIYNLMNDWKIYIDNSALIGNTVKNNLKISTNYLFFDGIKFHSVHNKYDNWLSSTDYSSWSNSYVEIANKKIYIMKENVKVLSTFRFYNKNELDLIVKKYDLKIKEENGTYYAYIDGHSSKQFEISENEKLVVIYCLEGGNIPENIYIHCVFEK